MERIVMVSGDFVRTGGMDMPNFAVAQYLADCGVSVQLVAFRVAEELSNHVNVQWHRGPQASAVVLFRLALARSCRPKYRSQMSRSRWTSDRQRGETAG